MLFSLPAMSRQHQLHEAPGLSTKHRAVRFGFETVLRNGLAVFGALVFGTLAAVPQDARAEEPPVLAEAVASGRLPPLSKRLPDAPRRDLPAREGWQPGRYGGTLRTLERGGRDARALVILGYARLAAWDPNYRIKPDILERIVSEDDRRFTLYLRPGHRWSDGHPFTAEDFRYWWEDIANDAALSPAGSPRALFADGQAPSVRVIDETTVEFAWSTRNPNFLPALAATSPLFIYRPAHYLRRFHARYRDQGTLEAAAKAAGLPGWAALHDRKDRMFRFDNPDLPTLQPWINTTAPPAERFVGRRNPFFHRVDGAGRQLPYIDEVVLVRAEAKLIPAQAAAGEADLQAHGLTLGDFTLLKRAEAGAGIAVDLWPIGRGAQLALYPNLNAADPVWRKLLRDVRFRRALSLAVDRDEINKIVYQGLALPGANTLLPSSPLYRVALREAWSRYDPKAAAALLDDLGLDRGADGLRRLPDGRTLSLIVETGNVDAAEVDVLELITGTWRAIGVELLIRNSGRQAFRQRVRAGRTVMSLFYGLANGVATADMSPAELAPTDDRQNNWPAWGLHFQTGGLGGEAPDMAPAKRLLALYGTWSRADSSAERADTWRQMLDIHADKVFTIGIVGGVLQPVVANARLRNLPQAAIFMYEPGAYFGIHRPDTFWLAE